MNATSGSTRFEDPDVSAGRPPSDPPPTDGPGDRPEPPHGQRPVATALALIAAGALWGLHVLGVDLRWELVLPIALIVLGLGVLVGGRSPATRGLVGLGIGVAVVAVVVAVFPATPSLTAGDRTWTVTEFVDLEDRYELGAGELHLDLGELELPPGTTELVVEVGAGELTVRVPADATVVVDAEVGLGELRAFDTRADGVSPSRRVTDGGAPGAGTLEIEARVGLGELEVTR